MTITIEIIREYQSRASKLKTIGEWKALGREVRDKFGLTDRQAICILNNDPQAILDLLEAR